jgi:hypothetical protein
VRGCPRSPLKKITQDRGVLPPAARASPAGPVLIETHAGDDELRPGFPRPATRLIWALRRLWSTC